MNFEGFQDLIRRVAQEWYKAAKKEIIELEMVISGIELQRFYSALTFDH